MVPLPRHLALLALTVVGCTQPGTRGPCDNFRTAATIDEPCGEELYFPSGIAMDPDGDVLYVTSYNADLRYAGGAVHSIDLDHQECVYQFARTGVLPPGCEKPLYPIFDDKGAPILDAMGHQIELHLDDPDPRSTAIINNGCPIPLLTPAVAGQTLAATEAECCQFDLLDPQILECDERPFITSAVKVSNFAGTIRVQRRNDAPSHRRLWIPVRSDTSVTWIDVEKPYAGNKPNALLPSQAHLSCPDPTNRQPGKLLDSCNAQRITVRDFHPAIPCAIDTDCPLGASCDTSVNTCTPVSLPADPFGIWLDEGHQTACQDGVCDATGAPYAHLVVTHLQGGEVTLINADAISPVSTIDQPPPTDPVVLDVRGNFFNSDANGRQGGFAVAPLTPGDPQSYWFVTSRLNPLVGVFRISESNLILPAIGFSVAGGPYSIGDDVRDIQVQPDGSRAFFIDNHPPSLFTLDTRPLLQGGLSTGAPTNQVVDVVDVCQGPAHLQMRQYAIAGAPGEPNILATRLYVVCFQTGQVWTIDPDQPRTRALIATGRGPNDIAFNFPAPRRATANHCSDGKPPAMVGGDDFQAGETDLDCGGACSRCAIGRVCRTSDDCESGVCADAPGACSGVPLGADVACRRCGEARSRRGYVSNFTDSTIAVIDLEPGSPTENRVTSRIGITSPPFNQ